jgi:hypothetical protein
LWRRNIVVNMPPALLPHCRHISGQTPDKWFSPSNRYRRICFFESIHCGDGFNTGDALRLSGMFGLLRMDRRLNQQTITRLYPRGWQWFTTAF